MYTMEKDTSPAFLPSLTPTCVRRNKRLREKASATPWRDFWEFENVSKSICMAVKLSNQTYHDDGSEQAQIIENLEASLEYVSVWKTRVSRISHAVESSAALAQLLLREAATRTSHHPSTISSTELRLAYASAITRSVNGLADVLQQQRTVASSVALLCSQLGIPEWLVDIRHESTHNQLPPLPVLQKAACTTLEYFRQVYWEPVCQEMYKQCQDAWELLARYHEAVLSSIETARGTAPAAQDVPPENDDSNDSSSEDDSDDVAGSWGSNKIGNNSNMFEVLQSPTNKRKRKRDDKLPTPPSTKRKKKKSASLLRTHAKSFAKSHLPFDVLRFSLLSFLVWSGTQHHQVGESQTGGMFVPPDSLEDTEVDFELYSRFYAPLLIASCREWPGLYISIIVHNIDAILSIEPYADSSSPSTNRRLFYLESWVVLLLSKGFLISAFDVVNSATTELEETVVSPYDASRKILEKLNLPWRSLYHRIMDRSISSDPPSRDTSLRIASHLTDIFGSVPTGMNHAGERDCSSPSALNDTSALSPMACDAKLSLDEIETLLKSKEERAKSQVAATDTKPANGIVTMRRKCWFRCDTWDECSIGCLPGHSS